LSGYEKDIVKLRNLVAKQRKRAIDDATKQNELRNWDKRILKQGPWDPVSDPISLGGAPSLPMPVKVADPETLAPFFEHVSLNGTEDKTSCARTAEEGVEIKEPYYNVKSLEFEKGVLYSDRRMDLCKMVLGPTNIGTLMESLRTNTFITHFLLGNNIIGPHGAKCIADFLKEFPDRMDTWYLAGNCIDSASLKILVDEWVKSTSVTNIWLKRNPLMPDSANDLFRLITQTENLRTLDLDQTELGDAGVAELFTKLAQHVPEKPISLRHIYLNANGIGLKAATAMGQFLASPHCTLDAVYETNNPIGNDGVAALAAGLKQNKSLTRLTLASTGLGDDGAIALCEALKNHPTMAVLELSQHFATPDLNSRYVHHQFNYSLFLLTCLQIQLDNRPLRSRRTRSRNFLYSLNIPQSRPVRTHQPRSQHNSRSRHIVSQSPLLRRQDNLSSRKRCRCYPCRPGARPLAQIGSFYP
jgi:Ran GTPase-activating protein (RanGAP) involved in mRNA processing and transport